MKRIFRSDKSNIIVQLSRKWVDENRTKIIILSFKTYSYVISNGKQIHVMEIEYTEKGGDNVL